jgi:ferredoxin-NADP reductase/DMSO/TMAO reductase YedYZ heme-binding membrane subunit
MTSDTRMIDRREVRARTGDTRASDRRFAKFLVIFNALVPGVMLAWDAAHHQLGANGVNYALHTTGLLALICLLLSLLVTPLRKLTGWNALIAVRRSLGLYAFFYACVHFAIFFIFDRALNVSSTIHEILSRRYLLIGSAGLLLMTPLALTSTNRMVMWLGAKRWKALHRLVYLVAIAGALHYYLLVKSDTRQPLVFAFVLLLLLGFRAVRYARDRGARRPLPLPVVAPVAGAPGKPAHWAGELRVARVFEETPDVRTLRLMHGEGGELPFSYQPGQYLNLTLVIDGQRVGRSYTIASSPTRNQYCEITVKKSAAGHGSRHLHEVVREGSRLKVSAPAGRFVFTGEGNDRVVLIAGGVGITPLMSMIRYLTDRCWGGEIYLVISVRNQADLIFKEELGYLQRRFANLHVCATLTKEPSGSDWAGERGAIGPDLLTRFVPALTGAVVFLCGPDGMMTAMRALLRALGVPESAVKTEAFASAAATPDTTGGADNAPAPGDTSAPDAPAVSPEGEPAQVRFERSARAFETPATMTILETAEAAGVEIPFECRSGICGQCKTRLLGGRVSMASEDALSAAEKARGLILACQARPLGRVTVDA